MSDARWTDVDDDLRAAVTHFRLANDLYQRGGFLGDGLEAYAAKMAFMHAMQSGHTSMEAAFVRVLKLLGESVPQGDNRHADLVRRVARGITGRPAMIGPALAKAANETRRFRNVATRSYDSFDPELARGPAAAAHVVAQTLMAEMAGFRKAVEPEP